MASNTGFDGLDDAVVSPGGTSVYAIAQNDDAVIHFDRNTGTGALNFAECFSGELESTTSGVGPCEDIPATVTNGTDTGLDSPSGIAISPTGNSLYVTSANDDAIALFSRNLGSGDLTYVGCITGESATGSTGSVACADHPTMTTGGVASGLDQPFSPVVSADGKSLYLGTNGDASVVWFDRVLLSGVLTFNDCITGETGTGPVGLGSCGGAVPTATALGTGSGMDRIQSIAIAPDGSSVYAGSQNDSTVNNFARNGTNGDLTLAECLTGRLSIGCTQVPSATTFGPDSGLHFVQSLAISPDGKSLYAAGAGDAAITTFGRAIGDGALTWKSCITGETESGPSGSGACIAPAGTTVGGIGSGRNLIRSLAVTSDGLQLIGGAEGDDSIVSAIRANAPQTTITSGPPLITNDPTASFTFSADEAGATFQCRVDSAVFAACSGSGAHTTAALSDGSHQFEVRARNDVASADPTPATQTVQIDTVAPDTEMTAGPTGAIAENTAEFQFAGLNGATTTQCSLDGEAFAACTSPKSFGSLADGDHSFRVRSTDSAGNVDPTPAERSFSIDTANPDTVFDKKPAKTERTNEKKKTYKFKFHSTEAGSTFECQRDKGKSWKACSSPYKKKYKQGKHTFKARSIDAVGNADESAAVRDWKVKPKG